MTIDDAAARIYREAIEALNAVRASPRASDEEVEKAKEEADALHEEWDRAVQASLDQSTPLLQALVARLEGITASIVTDPLQPIKDKINDVIHEARGKIENNA